MADILFLAKIVPIKVDRSRSVPTLDLVVDERGAEGRSVVQYHARS